MRIAHRHLGRAALTALAMATKMIGSAHAAHARDANANAEAPPTPPKPAVQLGQLEPLLGSWTCESKMPAGAMGNSTEIAFQMTLKNKPTLDGFWHQFELKSKKSIAMPNVMTIKGYWGWDSAKKQFWRTSVDNMGSFDVGWSKGFEGNRLVWNGETTSMGEKMPFRHTFTQKSAKEFVDTYEIERGGKWLGMGGGSCRR